MAADKHKSDRRVRNAILITLTTILTLIIVVAGALFAVANYYVSMIPKSDRHNPSEIIDPSNEAFETKDPLDKIPYDPDDSSHDPNYGTGPVETMDPGDVTWEDPSKLPEVGDDGLLNIMIVGQDTRRKTRGLSDTMLLVSINTKSNNVSLISFLRDTYVQIPGGYSDNKLNCAYRYGDFKLLRETLQLNFGITVDGFFECTFSSFKDVINTLGGVQVELTKKEADYMKNHLKISGIKTGMNTLNGEKALEYARIRKIDSDFGRTNRQRKIVLSLFNEFKDANVLELKAMAEKLLPMMRTDMSNSEILSLMQLIPRISSLKISAYSVPFKGAFEYKIIRGMDVVFPDLAKIRTKLANEYLPK